MYNIYNKHPHFLRLWKYKMCVQNLQSVDLHIVHLLMFDICSHETADGKIHTNVSYVHCVQEQGTFIFYKV